MIELMLALDSLNGRRCSNKVGHDRGKWWLEVAFADLQVTVVAVASAAAGLSCAVPFGELDLSSSSGLELTLVRVLGPLNAVHCSTEVDPGGGEWFFEEAFADLQVTVVAVASAAAGLS
jgi:hypothetical protein